jgi:hypothetical protein
MRGVRETAPVAPAPCGNWHKGGPFLWPNSSVGKATAECALCSFTCYPEEPGKGCTYQGKQNV